MDADLHEITVRIEWDSAPGRRSTDLVTRLNDPSGSRSPDLMWEDL